jgi:hypothetical protein
MKSGLAELTAVLAVAWQRNFSAAADNLGMSRSALSHAVSALEAYRCAAVQPNHTQRLAHGGRRAVRTLG